MRIAIDARLNAYRQGGIPQYTRQLMTALADVAAEEQIVSFQHRDQLRPLAIAPNVIRRTAFTPPHHRFEQWMLPLEVLLARPDVLHCPDFIAPIRRPCPAVVTIHDLAFMHYPEILDASARAYYSQVTTNAPRADAIIAVSEATRQDIAQFLDIPIEQIDVIHEAAALLYTQIELREGEARVLNSTPVAAGTFMLFVSTLEPRKNLPTLLQALRICIDRRPDAGYRLVIVGRRGWRDEAIFQTARDLKLADHVLFTGGVGQYDLRWLYNACRLYINPSLYEGFGLPLLEAMACGAPCLAAATSSLPEIGGDAAIYVPPLEAEQWADQIMALWDDEERRAELGRLGIARARQFSWMRSARETLKVYRRAVDRVVPRAEPVPLSRPVEAPESPLAIGSAALGPDAARPCLRCGTALLPGDLQIGVSMRSFQAEHDGRSLVPRMWTCPRCGYVELVAEPQPLVAEEHAPAIAEQPTQPPILPVGPDSDAREFTSAPPEEQAELAQGDQALVEVETDAAALELTGIEIQQDAPATPVEPSLETATPEAKPAPLDVASEPELSLETAVSEVGPAPSDLAVEQEPLLETALADTEPVPAELVDEPEPSLETALAESESTPGAGAANPLIDPLAAEQQAAEMAVAAASSLPGSDAPTDNHEDSATDRLDAPAVSEQHASINPLNGTAPKPKTGRGSRRQQPSAEPGGTDPPKRRSSRSKRKQTT